MAEISIWARDDDESQGMRDRMADVSDLLRKGCRPSRKQSTPHEPSAGAGPPALHAVDDALQMLVEILEEGGLQANRAATEFGRCGGHMSLLQLLQAEDNDPATESTRELAARAVDLCMVHCSRFPMKAAALDAKNTCDTMQCTFLVDSPMNSCGGAKLMKSRALGMSLSSSVVTALAVHSWADLRSLAGALKLHLRRRPNPNDAESRAAITISNMLWAVSCPQLHLGCIENAQNSQATQSQTKAKTGQALTLVGHTTGQPCSGAVLAGLPRLDPKRPFRQEPFQNP